MHCHNWQCILAMILLVVAVGALQAHNCLLYIIKFLGVLTNFRTYFVCYSGAS